MLIQVSKREFKHNQNEYQSHVVKVNFGSFTISWIVFIFVVLGMIALKKVTRYYIIHLDLASCGQISIL